MLEEEQVDAGVGQANLLDARLSAQRRLLQWLLRQVVQDRQAFDALLNELDAPWPPQDHQEDPGAVNTPAFGEMAAFNQEMRLLLRPLKENPPT